MSKSKKNNKKIVDINVEDLAHAMSPNFDWENASYFDDAYQEIYKTYGACVSDEFWNSCDPIKKTEFVKYLCYFWETPELKGAYLNKFLKLYPPKKIECLIMKCEGFAFVLAKNEELIDHLTKMDHLSLFQQDFLESSKNFLELFKNKLEDRQRELDAYLASDEYKQLKNQQ